MGVWVRTAVRCLHISGSGAARKVVVQADVAVELKVGSTDLARPTIGFPRLCTTSTRRRHETKDIIITTSMGRRFFFSVCFLLTLVLIPLVLAMDCFCICFACLASRRPEALFSLSCYKHLWEVCICALSWKDTDTASRLRGQPHSVGYLFNVVLWDWAHLFTEPQRLYDEMCL